uniref:Caspase domain-containing protein n=1 Tax=Candidatus Kentrum sp. DK TaxID=2126562 RepID=A0A450RYE1_9GAMM|nr:MAG: Caspase domain-containing protein [Candidatus Kentron sp. DK]
MFKAIYFAVLLVFAINLAGCATHRTDIPTTHLFPEEIPLKVAIRFVPDTDKDSVPVSIYKKTGEKAFRTEYKEIKHGTKELFIGILTKMFSDVETSGKNCDSCDLEIIVQTISAKTDSRILSKESSSTDTQSLAYEKYVYTRYNTKESSHIKYRVSILSDENEIADFIIEGISESFGTMKLSEAIPRPNSSMYSYKKWYSLYIARAFNLAESKAVKNFLLEFKKLDSENNLFSKLVEKNEAPAKLTVETNFSDKSGIFPNQAIDAKETAEITFSVENNGQGKAFDTTLDISTEGGTPIEILGDRAVGNIPPGGKKAVRLQIRGGLDLQDGAAKVHIRAKEKRGYDSAETVLSIPTNAIRQPGIAIAGYEINDGNTGLARGNGNKTPENGETIALVVDMENSGEGEAVDVELAIATMSDGIDVKKGAVTLPRIRPGQTLPATLLFSIPRAYAGKAINLKLTASDARKGISKTGKSLTFSMQTRQPMLSYTHRITDQDDDGLENGDSGEIVIFPENNGALDARSVVLELRGEGISLLNSRVDIGRIAAHSTAAPQRFPFQLPRILDREMIDLELRMRQADFAEVVDTIPVPIHRVRPGLEITHRVTATSGSDFIEQGETADLFVDVRNTGQLTAEEVKLEILTTSDNTLQKGVKLNAKSREKVAIGRISAGGKSEPPQRFVIDVQQGADTGTIPVRFRITQKDFPALEREITMKINPSGPREIRLAENRQSPMATRGNARPFINIVSPGKQQTIRGDFADFNAFVNDDSGVSKVTLTVNGKEVGGLEKDAANPRKQKVTARIPLKIGANEILITAYDTGGISGAESVRVMREAVHADYGRRVALVIGNSAYSSAPLANPKNDAADMTHALEALGFEVIPGFDLNRQQMEESIRRFREKMTGVDVGLFFYAGHAIQYDGKNYLIPIGANRDMKEEEVAGSLIETDSILKKMTGAGNQINIMMLDACRKNPFRSWSRSAILLGLAPSKLRKGTNAIVSHATAPGETAEDGRGKNSPYTAALVENIKTTGIDIEDMLKSVRLQVLEKTGGNQEPREWSSLTGDFFFGGE